MPNLCATLNGPDHKEPGSIQSPTHQNYPCHLFPPHPCHNTSHLCSQARRWPWPHRPSYREPPPNHGPSPEVVVLNRPSCSCRGVAKRELRQTVRFATQSDPTPALISNFLSKAPDRRLETIRSRTASLWTRTRCATKSLQLIILVPDDGAPSVTTPSYDDPVPAKDTCRFLHNVARDTAASKLYDLRDQGKTPRSLQTNCFANGSSFLYTGLNIRFKDWRFVHRARLNCLPVHAVKSRWSDADPTCRHCSEPKTLPHVLCHCSSNMPAITTRHNKIVDRLTTAVRVGSISTDKTVQDSGSPVRPDIVIETPEHVLLIDVCCPFKNGEEALEEAFARKEVKYNHLKAMVHHDPFEILGVWRTYYASLFTAHQCDPDAQDEMLQKLTCRLSQAERDGCEGCLMLEECFTALNGMPRRKTPSSDGFPMEFFLHFWQFLGADLVRVLNVTSLILVPVQNLVFSLSLFSSS